MSSIDPNVEPIPAGLGGLIPHLVVQGATEAVEFYVRAFGAVCEHRTATPDGRLMHVTMRFGKSALYLHDDFPDMNAGQARDPRSLGQTSVTLHQFVSDCDAAVLKAKDAGAEVVMEPMDAFWGDRYAVVQDPWGHRWSFATRLSNPPQAQVDAAGAAAFAPETS